MLKRFGLGKEERYLQFRSEIFNVFKHPNFDNPSVTVRSSTFGKNHFRRRAGRARRFTADSIPLAAGVLATATLRVAAVTPARRTTRRDESRRRKEPPALPGPRRKGACRWLRC